MGKYKEFARRHNQSSWEHHWRFVRQHLFPEVLVGSSAVIVSFVLEGLGVLSDWQAALYVSVGAVVLMWFSIILWSIFTTSYREWGKDGEQIAEKDKKILDLNNEKTKDAIRLDNKITELQEFIKKSSNHDKPDVSLVEAIYYIAFQRWGIKSVINDDGEYIDNQTHNNLLIAVSNARLTAISGQIPIWGLDYDKKMREYFVLIENPKDYWVTYWPNEEVFKYNDPQEMELEIIFDEYANKEKGHDWYYTNKNAVEKLWPPENILA